MSFKKRYWVRSILAFMGLISLGKAGFAQEIGTATLYGKTQSLSVLGPKPRSLFTGASVYINDQLQTVAEQTLKITLPDASEVWLTPDTDVTLTEYTVQDKVRVSGEIHLEKGLMHAIMTPSSVHDINFRVHTRAATLGVRGTEFLSEMNPEGGTTLHTLEGEVGMAPTREDLMAGRNFVIVKRGMMSELAKGQAKPSLPKAFDRKQVLEKLKTRSPDVAKEVEKRAAIQKTKPTAEHHSHWESQKPYRKARARKTH